MGASVSCHARWSLVWSRSEYNIVENDVEGVYNVVFVVTLIVNIMVKIVHYIPLSILWL